MQKILISALLFLSAPLAHAGDFDDCWQMFADGKPPALGADQAAKPRALCYQSFAVMHSGRSKTPLYVAERLSKASVSPEIERGTHFFADARLPAGERAELADYKNSGYDRGHMAPAADMPDDNSMAQCFTLANMVPQAPVNNRKTWAKIEKDTRKYAERAAGDVFVITGPVYAPKPNTIGRGKVWVPEHLFKLVYDPGAHKAWAYWLENTDAARAGAPISYAALVAKLGYKPMPSAAIE